MSEKSAPINIPVSLGELVDKITILQLKVMYLKRPEALKNVRRELTALEQILTAERSSLFPSIFEGLMNELIIINTNLWKVEDELRILEKKRQFGKEFITLARSVYQLNDKRAAIKKQINETCGSFLIEEKSYEKTFVESDGSAICSNQILIGGVTDEDHDESPENE